MPGRPGRVWRNLARSTTKPRAYDAAIVETVEYSQRFGATKPDCNVDTDSPAAAKAYMNSTGALILGNGFPIAVAKDRFAASMDALGAYMAANKVDTIEMPPPAKTLGLQVEGSVVFAAIDAALGSGVLTR